MPTALYKHDRTTSMFATVLIVSDYDDRKVREHLKTVWGKNFFFVFAC